MAEEPVRDRTWVDVQKKTFTRWCNNFLSERLMKLADLETDLSDGIKLINLLEILSGKSLGKYNKKAGIRPQKLENVSTALAFIKSERIKLVAIGPEDVVDCNLKLILGLIWTLILRFQIQTGEGGSPKQELLEWVRKQVAPYGLRPNNFSDDWTDGKTLSALTDSLNPGCYGYPNNLSGNALNDTQRAMDIAEKEFGIAKLMDAHDLVNIPDELSVMTYISLFRDWDSEANRRRRAAEEAERLRKLKTADPSQCFAFGPGLEGGFTNNDCPFTIQAVNYFGDPLPTGGDVFEVHVTGADSPAAKVTDNNNGTHSAVYVPRAVGPHTIAISLRGEPIKGSPYGPANINGPDAAHSYASGPGVEGARTGAPAHFKIHSVDKNGAPIPTGNDPFQVKVNGPHGPVTSTIKDNHDGTYDVAYNPVDPGFYDVDVTLNGQPIKGSPYKPLIESANAGQSWAEGDGLTGGKTDHPLHITIHAVDADGNPVQKGGDPFVVEISGPESHKPAVKDNGNGTYGVEYSVATPGTYNVQITLHGQPIKDSPFHPHVKPSADASKSYAEGPGLHEAFDNEPAHFTIHAVDKRGNPRTDGGDPFEVKISGPAPTPVEVKDNGDGTYSVTYHPDAPGDYKIDVTLEGHNIKDAPFHVTAKSGTDASLSGFATFSFTVQTRDKHGQNKNFGGDKFEVNISGPSAVHAQTHDNNDGTYSANYSLPQPGSYSIEVKLNGKAIGGSPLKQEF